MIDYESVIKPLEQSGKTDQQIASILSSVTRYPVPISELENMLDFNGLAKRNPINGSWEGPIADEIINDVHGLGDGLSELFSHINKSRSTEIAMNVPSWAERAGLLVSGLVASGIMTPFIADSVYALGGGKLYGDVTADDVSSSRTSHANAVTERDRVAEIEALSFELLNNYINPAKADTSKDADSVRAEIKAGL